jgi:hypothetical protein
MTLGLAFSRDRAMQLDGTLRSFFLHCRDADEVRLFVIYKTTSDFHALQYAGLAREYSQVSFIKETDFRRNVMELLIAYATGQAAGILRRVMIRLGARLGRINNLWLDLDRPRYVLFLVDDNIFVRDFRMREVHEALQTHPRALGFSLRLGTNTRYCYPLDKPETPPPFTRFENRIIEFDWVAQGDSGHSFAYPLEVSSSVYRINELLRLLNRLSFQNPNTLEGQMATRADMFRRKSPYLLCYEQSVTFCNPVNRVQTVYANRAAAMPQYSTERLAKMFEGGYRIEVEAYTGFVPNACHQEVELVLQKREISVQDAV